MEAVLGIIFLVVMVVFVTLGSVLIMFFWAGGFAASARALSASALAIVMLLGPIVGIAATQQGTPPGALAAMAVVMFAITFPVAFLATRKLDRRKENIAAIFD